MYIIYNRTIYILFIQTRNSVGLETRNSMGILYNIYSNIYPLTDNQYLYMYVFYTLYIYEIYILYNRKVYILPILIILLSKHSLLRGA